MLKIGSSLFTCNECLQGWILFALQSLGCQRNGRIIFLELQSLVLTTGSGDNLWFDAVQWDTECLLRISSGCGSHCGCLPRQHVDTPCVEEGPGHVVDTQVQAFWWRSPKLWVLQTPCRPPQVFPSHIRALYLSPIFPCLEWASEYCGAGCVVFLFWGQLCSRRTKSWPVD